MKYFVVFSFAILALGTVDNAHAYVDPGAGSFLLQGLMIWAVGAFAGIKSFLSFRSWFKKKHKREQAN